MSKYTIDQLNRYTRLSRRAWHTDDKLQLMLPSPTVFDGPVPIEAVKELLGWKVVEGNVRSSGFTEVNDELVAFEVNDPARKAMLRPPGALTPHLKPGDEGYDEGGLLGIFKQSYVGHDYLEWLYEKVSPLLGLNVDIFSAGLLAQGAQAWVQMSVPELFKAAADVEFRPNLLATTSFDGSSATRLKRTITDAVCDNTREAALAEDGAEVKVRHSKYSKLKLDDARETLGLEMLETVVADFRAEVEHWTSVKVDNGQWSKYLDEIAPLKDANGDPKTGRALTMAGNKRDQFNQLWNNDDRVNPWKGTAYGVVQAANTWAEHIQSFKGDNDRAMRNFKRTLDGGIGKDDQATKKLVLDIVGAA